MRRPSPPSPEHLPVPARRSREFFQRKPLYARTSGIYDCGPFIGRTQAWAEDFLVKHDLAVRRLGKARASFEAYRVLSKGHTLPTLVEQWSYIDSDEGGRMNLRLRRASRFILRIIHRYWTRDERLHLRILKSRRQGISTAVTAAFEELGNQIPYWKTLQLADKDEHTRTLIDIMRFIKEERKFGPGGKWQSAGSKGQPRYVVGRPLRSRFEYETSGGKNVGRSKGYRALHRSEVAFMGDVMAQDAGLLATIPKHVGFCAVIDESTANGAGGPFYRGWTSGWRRPQRHVFSVFLPWIIDERCYIEVSDAELEQYCWDALDEEEKILVQHFGACIEQLAFRRFTIEADCNGDVDLFHQEFPTTPDEAWLTAGRQVFDRKILLWLSQRVDKIQPYKAGDLISMPDDARSFDGDLHTWQRADAVAGPAGSTAGEASTEPTTTATPRLMPR